MSHTILTDAQCLTIGAFGQSPLKRHEHARAVEQAVLQSPEVQAWKKDAERYHEIRSRLTGASYDPKYFEGLFIAGCMGHPDDVDKEVDAAMEHKT